MLPQRHELRWRRRRRGGVQFGKYREYDVGRRRVTILLVVVAKSERPGILDEAGVIRAIMEFGSAMAIAPVEVVDARTFMDAVRLQDFHNGG